MGSSPPPKDRPAISKEADVSSSWIYEWRIIFYSLVAVAPGVLGAAVLIWLRPWALALRVSLILLVLVLTAYLVRVLHEQIVRPIHTLTNVVAALREEDFSFRARGATPNDPLGALALEINSLAEILATQNTRTVEATALMRRVIESVDAPMFAFDPADCLRLVNSAGERLLRKPASALLGRSAEQLGLTALMRAENEVQLGLPQTPDRRWFVRRSHFRQGGVPHTLLVLSDLSRVLREEERMAWQRLIRVLGHELNNSLAPIKSIAGSLANRVNTLPLEDAEQTDFRRGLNIIEARAASLNRFLQAYRRLAQMPLPSLSLVKIGDLVQRVAALETRLKVEVHGGPELSIALDPDQVEQMLINLVKNAADAALENPDVQKPDAAQVAISWSAKDSQLSLEIRDNGPGLLNPDNAFVPFYTTKQQGTGIGLVLSRQIAEAHHGTIRLANRKNEPGCVATVLLPMNPPHERES
jgi:two-component system, NtrC family, nitrogen regulation sensor histidine kinase NtrY